MAGHEEWLIPEAVAREINPKRVEVTLTIPGLIVKRSESEDNVNVTPSSFHNIPFQVEAVVRDRNGVRRYRYLKEKLPGEIIPKDCDLKYKDGYIIVVFAKKPDPSWEPAIDFGELNGDPIK